MKLRTKIFIIFLSLFFILSVLVGLLSFITANRIIIDNYTTKVEENLDYVYNSTSQRIVHLNEALNYLIGSDALRSRMTVDESSHTQYEIVTADTELNMFLSNFVNFDFFQSINNIYIFNTSGQDYYGSVGFISEYQREVYKKMALATAYDTNNKLQYVEHYNDFDFLESSYVNLRFFKPVYDMGELYAYFFIDIDSSYFLDLFSAVNLEADTALYMIDSNNKILQSSISDEVGELFKYPSEDSIVSERYLNEFGWTIISVTPSSIVTADTYTILTQALAVTAFLIIIAGILIFIIVNRMTAPIKMLMRGIEKVRAGNLNVFVKKTSTDEIGEMTETFNTMVSDLNLLVSQKIQYMKEFNDAQYKVLQSQINPHFIYNTLNTVKFMAGVQNATNISNMVDLISDLLRLSSHTTGQFVPLKQELLIVETYIKIQQIRYNYKFKYTINVNDESNKTIVPKFIVEPLVENAIFHGIEPKKGLGMLNIDCCTNNNILHITVSDNGIGMTADKITTILNNKTTDTNGLNGIGLPNVNNRLILLFGKQHALKIESEQGVGTKMFITLPTAHDYE